MSEQKLNIYQRINSVMKKVKYVQKDKQVTGGGTNYKAVTHDQVISIARQELVDNGIVIVPRQIQGELLIKRDPQINIKMHLYSGAYEIDFVNMDSPDDKITVQIEAHANDNGDKAPGKAITYATKAAILKVLSLETGEDDESRTEQDSVITDFQAKTIRQILSKKPAGVEGVMLQSLQVDSIEQISKRDYDKTIANLKATSDANN